MESNKTMSTTNPDQTPKITVYRGWLDPGKYVWSPFVIKLEARLRFAEIPYVTEPGSMREAPKGKIPYIECRDLQPSTLGDSALIIKNLIEENVLPDINAKLSSTTRTQDLALRALLEDKLYFYHTWERWIENYYTMRDRVLSAVPFPVRVVVGLVIYRKVAATLSGQGTSRYTVDEIRSFRREIWESVNELLISAKATTSASDGPFWVLGGENPTEADATLFGFIVSVLVCTAGPESQNLVKEFPVLLEYAGRIHDAYFPDYVKWS